MQVILNEQGYVDSYALIGGFGETSIEVVEPENIDDFENNYRSYYLYNGNMLVKNNDKQKEIEEQIELSNLRTQRNNECFPYINRGYLWYSKLTDEQKEELASWYQAWLDVTDTKVVPNIPVWLH